jgi:uncharacterized protein (TIGR02646 family)
MKRCKKLPEPASLETYRQAQPQGTWENMRNDPFYGGQEAYREIKSTLVRGQRCLCAYCEFKIADGMDEESIAESNYKQRVEHFHPKHDRTGSVNWALEWSNLWAVCQGGSQETPGNTAAYLPPLPENLSCDAFKDHQIREGRLSENPEGWILDPDEIPAFPLLFGFSPEGVPEPNLENCETVVLTKNNHSDTATMVSETIKHLNLGCTRLSEARRIVKAQLEKQIGMARKKSPGVAPQEVLFLLAQRLFSSNTDSPWSHFFSLIRWRLGDVAEQHLRSIGYEG